MSIKTEIENFNNGLNQTKEKSIKFAIFNGLKMFNQLDNIRRYIKKEIKGEKNLEITSQELRTYCISIEKVLKEINKKSNFREMQKRIEKELEKNKKTEVINYDMVTKESNETIKYIRIAQLLQGCFSWINHYAWIIYLIECEHKYKKYKSDKCLEEAINETLNELLK